MIRLHFCSKHSVLLHFYQIVYKTLDKADKLRKPSNVVYCSSKLCLSCAISNLCEYSIICKCFLMLFHGFRQTTTQKKKQFIVWFVVNDPIIIWKFYLRWDMMGIIYEQTSACILFIILYTDLVHESNSKGGCLA